MALEAHPNVFRFDGRLWVSELPGAEARAQLVEQRTWDAAHVKSQRWVLALVVGAAVGTAATLGLGTLAGLAPAIYLVLLPLGFGAGAVLGAVVNKRLLGDRLTAPTATPRPTTIELTRIPSAVARRTDASTPVADLIAWSKQGFVPKA
ncbi:hypothetical protein [Antiquaquibacter soli]|uniref:Uncharacterized protein n=1 Tax=Antiquaquibacter soli TaxID=3064523 RepID=A0ABT9BS46_9MICO|nr:hypothetical protein [Protaetiibacter sp. WY-16]MDO7882162.1 hypothetical protein [Protaetiibacter sp. WY-16]